MGDREKQGLATPTISFHQTEYKAPGVLNPQCSAISLKRLAAVY